MVPILDIRLTMKTKRCRTLADYPTHKAPEVGSAKSFLRGRGEMLPIRREIVQVATVLSANGMPPVQRLPKTARAGTITPVRKQIKT